MALNTPLNASTSVHDCFYHLEWIHVDTSVLGCCLWLALSFFELLLGLNANESHQHSTIRILHI